MNNIKKEIIRYLEVFPPALEVFHQLLEIGNVYVMGGLLREYKDNQKLIELRDADFCLEIEHRDLWEQLLKKISYTTNRFGGYKLNCKGFIIDIWEIENTWAFRTGKVLAEKNEYFAKLPSTVFLNLDGLAYDLIHDEWNDAIYQKAMKKGELDVVLEENPFVELNIVRAMVLQNKYKMTYSERLKRIILQYVTEQQDWLKQLIDIQWKRYNYLVLNEAQINMQLEELKNKPM